MEGDDNVRIIFAMLRNFNPLPPYGGRPKLSRNFFRFFPFQSTPSVWRETSVEYTEQYEGIYFNPLPPYGGRPAEQYDG